MPGASSPGDQTPLETFVNDSVSRSLIEYFEDKGDSGKQDLVTKPTCSHLDINANFIPRFS